MTRNGERDWQPATPLLMMIDTISRLANEQLVVLPAGMLLTYRADVRRFYLFDGDLMEGYMLEIPDDFIRNEAWKAGGIPYNPDAAFPKFAREHDLGNPETPEFDFVHNGIAYRGQGYSKAIVYCPIGRWNDIRTEEW